ncbi:TPA: morphogenetic protein [Yersinia enterocolitica]
MNEKPILFNSEMVNAILSGRKTQTRRIISEKTLHLFGVAASAGECHPLELCDERSQSYYLEFCPLGKPGDQLWVRETWNKHGGLLTYRADHDWIEEMRKATVCPAKWVPSIHMPRWASRINLLITGVRVERLNDISDADAMSEGIDADRLAESQDHYDCIADHNMTGRPTAKGYFSSLWQSIYGEENWEANPWVWVINFERMEAK